MTINMSKWWGQCYDESPVRVMWKWVGCLSCVVLLNLLWLFIQGGNKQLHKKQMPIKGDKGDPVLAVTLLWLQRQVDVIVVKDLKVASQ